jgi:hypothetical protein
MIWDSYCGSCEEFYVLWYNAVHFCESIDHKQISSCWLLHVGFMLGLFFSPDDQGEVLLRDVSWLFLDYTSWSE